MVTMLWMLLLQIAFTSKLIAPFSKEPIQYQYQTTFYEDADHTFLFRWNITDNDLIGQLSYKSFSLDWSWIAIGFGSNGMLHSEMIVCHNLNNGNVELHEHVASGQYLAPAHDEVEVLSPISGFVEGGNHTCAFRRPLTPTNKVKTQLYSNRPLKMIWAFNPASKKNYEGKYFTVHDPAHRGAVSLRLSDGAALPASVPSFKNRQIHGFGMMTVWLFVLPFGAFYARYFRFVSGWVVVKIINQTVGSILTLAFLYFALTGEARFDQAHSFLGITILTLMLSQIIMGVLTVLGMSNESLDHFKKYSRFIHMTTGYCLFVMGVVQIGLGLNILYPWLEPRQIEPWVIFASLCVLWLVAFALAEYNLKVKTRRQDPGYGKEVDFPLLKSEDKEKTQFYTWESLDEEIKSGKMLVVGNGKYVYDISRWIGSHPGGQIILHNVNGTDISNDYFHEAGFDADEFTPLATPPPKREHEEVAVAGLSRADVLSAKRSSIDSFSFSSKGLGVLNVRIAPDFDQQDWSCIQRARRTHVHTKLALQKLATLVVGRIKNGDDLHRMSSSVQTLNTSSETSFSQFEYRRYAMTKKEIESSADATKPFVRFKFCLLYPYDVRQDQPTAFVPGQAIEIQVRLSDGTRVSRYYTPISGDMTSFEILVKIQPTGSLSRYLYASEPGERQFKIRGPFGLPLVPRPVSSFHPEDSFDTIYFFAGGSGVTPCLQIINHLLLAKKTPLMIVQAYRATLSDEISVSVGDRVEVLHHYLDGWCFGTNLTTNKQGTFPVGCAMPASPTKLVLFNVSDLSADMMGINILEGAKLAYPALLDIHRFDSKSLTPPNIRPLLDTNPGNFLVVVCGPSGLNGTVVDMLSEFGGPWSRNMRILTSDRPN